MDIKTDEETGQAIVGDTEEYNNAENMIFSFGSYAMSLRNHDKDLPLHALNASAVIGLTNIAIGAIEFIRAYNSLEDSDVSQELFEKKVDQLDNLLAHFETLATTIGDESIEHFIEVVDTVGEKYPELLDRCTEIKDGAKDTSIAELKIIIADLMDKVRTLKGNGNVK